MGHEVSLQRKAQNVVSTLVSAGLYSFDIGSQRLTLNFARSVLLTGLVIRIFI